MKDFIFLSSNVRKDNYVLLYNVMHFIIWEVAFFYFFIAFCIKVYKPASYVPHWCSTASFSNQACVVLKAYLRCSEKESKHQWYFATHSEVEDKIIRKENISVPAFLFSNTLES